MKRAFGISGKFISCTSNTKNTYRGDKIKDWLEIHNYKWDGDKIENFIIIDDLNDMGSLQSHLVHVNGAWGLSEDNVVEAINKLNKVVPGK